MFTYGRLIKKTHILVNAMFQYVFFCSPAFCFVVILYTRCPMDQREAVVFSASVKYLSMVGEAQFGARMISWRNSYRKRILNVNEMRVYMMFLTFF